MKRMRWQEDEHMRSVAALAVYLTDVTEMLKSVTGLNNRLG